ncbi:MAG: hypothetical protein JW934_13765 [Anaerolineae bacterium]|nr:hypothetical protein [Anaerolineae bacterium]
MADYRLVTGPDGTAEGVWLRDAALAQDRLSLVFLLTKEGLPEDLRVAAAAGDYRVVANSYDSSGGCFVMWGSLPVPGEQAAPAQRPVEPVAAARPQPAPVPAPTPERVPEPPQPPAPFRGGKTLLVGSAMTVIGFLLSLPCAFLGGIFVGALAAWLWMRWEKTAPRYAAGRGALAGFFAGIGSFCAIVVSSLTIGALGEVDLYQVLTALALGLILGLFSAVAIGTLTGFLIGRGAKAKQTEPARERMAPSPVLPRPISTLAETKPAARAAPQPAVRLAAVPVPGICFQCHKPLPGMFEGASGGVAVMSGDALMTAMARAPYPCKSCGTHFCVDCMAKIKKENNHICPYCKQDNGW